MALLRLSLAFLVCAGLGCANAIILTGVDAPLGEQNTLWIDEGGTNTQLYWAGGINVSVDGHPRVLWCVQLFVNINLNTNYNTTVDFADTPNLQRVGWMVKNLVSSVTTQTQGAAFQLAIWDIIEDNGDGFAVGAGKVTQSTDLLHPTDSSVLTAAQAYEAQSVGKSFAWVPVYHNVTISGGKAVQNLIGPIVDDGGPLSFAPEPPGLSTVLAGFGLIAAGLWRRRRSPRQPPAR
jgi:hypothetical protein